MEAYTSAEPHFCNKCIPFTEAQQNSAPPHYYHAYPHKSEAWVEGTELFCCMDLEKHQRAVYCLFFLKQDDLQNHLDSTHPHRVVRTGRVLQIGFRWRHKELRRLSSFDIDTCDDVRRPTSIASANVGELHCLCPQRGCSATNLTDWHDPGGFPWQRVDEHMEEHSKHVYPLDLQPTLSVLKNRLEATRWSCARPDCTRIFHRWADSRRHLLVHDQNQPGFPCPIEGCDRGGSNGFPRKDKLRDHMRAKHRSLAEELMEPRKRPRITPRGNRK